MKTGFQIYMKRSSENTFVEAGLNNWFSKEEDAIARCEVLNNSWKDFGYEYVVVKLG